MTHPDFLSAYRSGAVRVEIDRQGAARFVSARLLLPFVMLPVLGVGVALALTGWLWTGFIVIGFGTLARVVIRRSAPHFVLTQALEDPKFYGEARDAGLLKITSAAGDNRKG